MIIVNPSTGQDIKDKKFNHFVDKVVQFLYDHHKVDFCNLIKKTTSNLEIDYGTATKITSAFYNSATGAHKPWPRAYSFTGITGNFYLCKDWNGTKPRRDNRDYDHLKDMVSTKFPMYAVLKVNGEFQLVDATSEGKIMVTVPDVLSPDALLLKSNRNIILYGPPGTGKTYHTVNKALEILAPCKNWNEEDRNSVVIPAFKEYRDTEKQIVFTTFHQSMSYEDFIEGIKPDLSGSSIGYKIEDGIFKKVSIEASKNPKKNYVLIIDEINRGNIANIFGELITLIEEDKRAGCPEALSVTLPYSKEPFSVPQNLYIIGTMNTADRSVEALDSALRRRFSFEEMMPNADLLNAIIIDGLGKSLGDLLATINERVEVLKDREHQIGHSYLTKFIEQTSVNPDDLKSVFSDKFIPLLQEYFYGDYEKIQIVLGKGFVEEVKIAPAFAGNANYDDIPEKRYSIVKNPDMKEALRILLSNG